MVDQNDPDQVIIFSSPYMLGETIEQELSSDDLDLWDNSNLPVYNEKFYYAWINKLRELGKEVPGLEMIEVPRSLEAITEQMHQTAEDPEKALKSVAIINSEGLYTTEKARADCIKQGIKYLRLKRSDLQNVGWRTERSKYCRMVEETFGYLGSGKHIYQTQPVFTKEDFIPFFSLSPSKTNPYLKLFMEAREIGLGQDFPVLELNINANRTYTKYTCTNRYRVGDSELIIESPVSELSAVLSCSMYMEKDPGQLLKVADLNSEITPYFVLDGTDIGIPYSDVDGIPSVEDLFRNRYNLDNPDALENFSSDFNLHVS